MTGRSKMLENEPWLTEGHGSRLTELYRRIAAVYDKDEALRAMRAADDRTKFVGEIDMGSHRTFALMGLLHLIVDDALSTVSSKQQNGLYGYDFNVQSDLADRQHAEKLCRELVTALGCKHILK